MVNNIGILALQGNYQQQRNSGSSGENEDEPEDALAAAFADIGALNAIATSSLDAGIGTAIAVEIIEDRVAGGAGD